MAHFDAVLPGPCTGRLRAHGRDTETEVRRLLATAGCRSRVLPAVLRERPRPCAPPVPRGPSADLPDSVEQWRNYERGSGTGFALGRYSPTTGPPPNEFVRVLTRMQQTRTGVAVMTRSRRRKLQRLAAAPQKPTVWHSKAFGSAHRWRPCSSSAPPRHSHSRREPAASRRSSSPRRSARRTCRRCDQHPGRSAPSGSPSSRSTTSPTT